MPACHVRTRARPDVPVCPQGMRVVNIVGFRRGYSFLNELLALAKPFGKVVKHLVLDLRAEVERWPVWLVLPAVSMVTPCLWQAYLQFETEEQAKTMARFYNTNVTASVCGRPVRISHSTSYPTIQVSSAPAGRPPPLQPEAPNSGSVPSQCGSSKVVYVGNIPSNSFSDESILKLAEPFGKVSKYFTNRIKREVPQLLEVLGGANALRWRQILQPASNQRCFSVWLQAFIEMENAEDAEKMGEYCKEKALKFNGNRLMVYVSRKYRQLKHGSVSSSVVGGLREAGLQADPPSAGLGIEFPAQPRGRAAEPRPGPPDTLKNLQPRNPGGRRCRRSSSRRRRRRRNCSSSSSRRRTCRRRSRAAWMRRRKRPARTFQMFVSRPAARLCDT